MRTGTYELSTKKSGCQSLWNLLTSASFCLIINPYLFELLQKSFLLFAVECNPKR